MDMTKQELSQLTGLTYRQVYNINRKLVQEDESKALFVRGEDGKKCDLATFVKRWVEYNVDRASVDAQDLEAVKAQHEAVKMRKTQLEVDQMEGALVDVGDVRRIWGDIANAVMQNLMHIPSVVAPMVQGQTNVEIIAGILDKEIRKTLNQLSETPLPEYLLLAEDGEDEE